MYIHFIYFIYIIVLNTICICSVLLNSCDCLRSEHNFLSPDRVSARNDVTSDKILQKMRTSRVCVALKTICSSCTLINIKLR